MRLNEYMWLSNIRHFIKRRATWIVFWSGFVGGVLPDIDHAINYWYPQESGARFLHGWFCFISVIVLCCLISYAGRLYRQSILKK